MVQPKIISSYAWLLEITNYTDMGTTELQKKKKKKKLEAYFL